MLKVVSKYIWIVPCLIVCFFYFSWLGMVSTLITSYLWDRIRFDSFKEQILRRSVANDICERYQGAFKQCLHDFTALRRSIARILSERYQGSFKQSLHDFTALRRSIARILSERYQRTNNPWIDFILFCLVDR